MLFFSCSRQCFADMWQKWLGMASCSYRLLVLDSNEIRLQRDETSQLWWGGVTSKIYNATIKIWMNKFPHCSETTVSRNKIKILVSRTDWHVVGQFLLKPAAVSQTQLRNSSTWLGSALLGLCRYFLDSDCSLWHLFQSIVALFKSDSPAI